MITEKDEPDKIHLDFCHVFKNIHDDISNHKYEESDPVTDKPEEAPGWKPDFLAYSVKPARSEWHIQATISPFKHKH